jgi:hypothetical protein
MKRAAIVTMIWGAILAAAIAAPSHADNGLGPVVMQRIAGEPLTSFATRFFYKRHPNAVNWDFAKRYRSTENWAEIVREQVYAAEIDINGDGVPELFLVVDNANWCEANGCLGAIFRRTPKAYELICETALPPPASPPMTILAEIENGYHHLATTDKTILWNERQDYDSGQLCATERRGE